MRQGVRKLLLLAALTAGTGVVAAPPAHALGLQHCQFVKGTLRASPGLTDVATDQTITLAARVTGCSRAGGSGVFVATTGAPQATCAILTTKMAPATATILWHSGKSSTIAVTFGSTPDSPNRLALTGRVVSGAGAGDHVEGGLHLIGSFARKAHSSAESHKTAAQQPQPLPLNNDVGSCTAAHPLGTVKISSYQSLKFTVSFPSPTPAEQRAKAAAAAAAGSSTTTTISPEQAALQALAGLPSSSLPKKPGHGFRHPVAAPKRPAIKRFAAAGSTGGNGSGSDSFLDPESVLLAVCIGAAICLLALLLMPPRRRRRQRTAPHLRS